MNIETNSPNLNDPAVLEERVASFVNTLLTVADPRLITKALLSTAAELSTFILQAERATPAQIAQGFTSALVVALQPREEAKPRIEVVPAGVIDLSTRR